MKLEAADYGMDQLENRISCICIIKLGCETFLSIGTCWFFIHAVVYRFHGEKAQVYTRMRAMVYLMSAWSGQTIGQDGRGYHGTSCQVQLHSWMPSDGIHSAHHRFELPSGLSCHSCIALVQWPMGRLSRTFANKHTRTLQFRSPFLPSFFWSKYRCCNGMRLNFWLRNIKFFVCMQRMAAIYDTLNQ